MEAQLILAESATSHPDGTVSMLRGGITHLWSQTPPYFLNGALVVRIGIGPEDAGVTHEFRLLFMDQDGGSIIPPLTGAFDAPKGGGNVNLVLGVGWELKKAGVYSFHFLIDKVERGRWTITCATPPQTEQKP